MCLPAPAVILVHSLYCPCCTPFHCTNGKCKDDTNIINVTKTKAVERNVAVETKNVPELQRIEEQTILRRMLYKRVRMK